MGKDAAKDEALEQRHNMLSPFTAGWQMVKVEPLIIEKSEGIYVYDTNGNKYLDALAGLWNNALGGNEPRLVEAAKKQLDVLPYYHSFWNRTTPVTLELAKELVEMFTQVKMSRVLFTNSGSESNDSQVRLVWYYYNAIGKPHKKKFIAREKAYHGSTYASASLSGLPNLHKGFDAPASFVVHTDCPHYWRNHLPGESEEDFATRLADNLEKLILKEGPENIAAFIGEPLMAAGGVMPPPATYWDKIQPILKKYDILLIADEVVCAFGRLGTMFGCDYYNIKPDLVSMAKALSSAYMPIGAVLVSEKISDAILKFSDQHGSLGHGFTYSGHPVPCAVALEALHIYKERDIPGHVAKVSPHFQKGLHKLSSSPVIGEIRGTGLIIGVEFKDGKRPENTFPADWGVSAYFADKCKEEGMLVRISGDAIFMSPTLTITIEEIDELITMFEKALKATEKYVESKKKSG
ncbi:hypothetical protein SELMODRAFT_177017 [Selaginella moellendorffii]|uniref:Aminotransferase n=1 Tax=Selaginella moellendorffii TaxID=88036 RepID=D8S5D5_SELML|nr:gamma aminobutyrate transaminase 1, mitochondrial [Selaginella moellendorffii]EFJ20434.1 hypothetical protein SELMODRAFT_177017 [Selaginella moellendorffii]|eukprot:XP_002978448.1 gamma aminobutyrate transaminase 1, mitochondrial [Selaginella moellendorffii]